MLAIVGSRTTTERSARGLGLRVYDVDPTFEQWRLLQTIAMVNPSFQCIDEQGKSIFTVHGDLTQVSSLVMEQPQTLKPSDQRPTLGRNPVHLALSSSGRFLVVANYASGAISSLPVGREGMLGDVCDVLRFQGQSGPHRVEQAGSHPHQVARWPGTDLFFVPDKGLDLVHLVELAGDGQLSLRNQMLARSGAGPRHAAFDPPNSRAWICNELDSTLTTCHFDVRRASLTAERITPLLPESFVGENRAAGIAAHPSGKSIYVSNRGMDALTVLSVDPGKGAVTERRWVSTYGRVPRFLTLSPDATALLVANEGTDSIVSYRIQDDGALQDGHIVAQTGSPVCITFLHTSTGNA